MSALPVPKYVAPPNANILGIAIKAFVESILYEDIKPFFETMMRENGYASPEIQDMEWYPLQMILDMDKKIAASPGGSTLLVSIGTKVIETALLPPEIDSIAKCITLLRDISDMNLQNVPSHINYRDIVIEDRRVSFVDATVFPHDLVYGYVFGLARRFKNPGTFPVVHRTYLDETNPDADGATYEIVW